MCRSCRTLAILPAVFVVLCVVVALLNYFTTTLIDHDVYPLIPNIDETEDKHPNTNIFSQIFNICSVILLFIVFVRYLQVKHDGEWNEESRPLVIKLNQAGLFFGILASLGASLVANFQSVLGDENVKTVHFIGTGLLLFCGVALCWLQTVISYKMKLCGINSTGLFITRAVCSVLVSLFAVVCLSLKEYADHQWIQVSHNKTTAKWSPDDVGFVPHVISNVTEWVIAIILLVFILTFVGEFKNMKVKLLVSRYSALPMPLASSSESMRTPLLM